MIAVELSFAERDLVLEHTFVDGPLERHGVPPAAQRGGPPASDPQEIATLKRIKSISRQRKVLLLDEFAFLEPSLFRSVGR